MASWKTNLNRCCQQHQQQQHQQQQQRGKMHFVGMNLGE
jgi:hypothetical protein